MNEKYSGRKRFSCFTSGCCVCVVAAWTGSTDGTTGVKGRDLAISVAACWVVDVTGTDADASCSSRSSVSPWAKAGNAWTGNTVFSSWAGCAVVATNTLESSGTESTVVIVWTSGRGWLVDGEESSSAGSSSAVSSVAAAGWDDRHSSSPAETVWPDDLGKGAADCWVFLYQKEERKGRI